MSTNLTYPNLTEIIVPSQSQDFKCDYHASDRRRRCTGWILSVDGEGPPAMTFSGKTYRADNSPKRIGARVGQAQCSVHSVLGERCTGEVITNYREIPEYWFYGAMGSYLEFMKAVGVLWNMYFGEAVREKIGDIIDDPCCFENVGAYQYSHFSVEDDYACQLGKLRHMCEFKKDLDDGTFPYGLRMRMECIDKDFDVLVAIRCLLTLEDYVHGIVRLSDVDLETVFDMNCVQLYKYCSYQTRLWLGIVFMLYGKPAYVGIIDGKFIYDTFKSSMCVVYRSMDGVRRCSELCGACEVCLVHYCEHDMIASFLELVDYRRLLRDYVGLYVRDPGMPERKKVSVYRILKNFCKIVTFDRWAIIIEFLMIAPGSGHFADVMEFFFASPWTHGDVFGILGGKALDYTNVGVYNEYINFFRKKIGYELYREGVDFAFGDVRRQTYNLYEVLIQYYEVYHYYYINAVQCRRPEFYRTYGCQSVELGMTVKLEELKAMSCADDVARYTISDDTIESFCSEPVCDMRETRARGLYIIRMLGIDMNRMRKKSVSLTYEGHSMQSVVCVFNTSFGVLPGTVVRADHSDDGVTTTEIGDALNDSLPMSVVKSVARNEVDVVVSDSEEESSDTEYGSDVDQDRDSVGCSRDVEVRPDTSVVEAMMYKCYVSQYDYSRVRFATEAVRTGLMRMLRHSRNSEVDFEEYLTRVRGLGVVVLNGRNRCTGMHIGGYVYFPAHALKYHESEDLCYVSIGDGRKTAIPMELDKLDSHIDVARAKLRHTRGVSSVNLKRGLKDGEINDAVMCYGELIAGECRRVSVGKIEIRNELCVSGVRLSKGQSGGMLLSADGGVLGMYLGACKFSLGGDDDDAMYGSLFINMPKLYALWKK